MRGEAEAVKTVPQAAEHHRRRRRLLLLIRLDEGTQHGARTRRKITFSPVNIVPSAIFTSVAPRISCTMLTIRRMVDQWARLFLRSPSVSFSVCGLTIRSRRKMASFLIRIINISSSFTVYCVIFVAGIANFTAFLFSVYIYICIGYKLRNTCTMLVF